MKQRLCCSRTGSFNTFFYNHLLIFVGRGGTFVDSMSLDLKVVGLNSALAATPGTLKKYVPPLEFGGGESHLLTLTVVCSALRVNSDTVSIAVVGSASE